MIGMMNVPCDSPAEFYAIPDRYVVVYPESYGENMNEPSSYSGSTEKSNSPPNKRPSLLNLFSRRKTSNIKYLQDGRKVYNGELVEHTPPPKLWEQLIVRTIVHKIEDEVKSPLDQFSTLQSTFPRLTGDQKSRSKSTFSLVSQDRVTSQCEKCCPSKKLVETCRWLSRKASDVGDHDNSSTKTLVSNHQFEHASKSKTKSSNRKFLTVN